MDVLRRIRRQDRCVHKVTMTVQSLGIERVVCEACGHVSVHFLSDLTGERDRDRFARPVEREGKHARAEDELTEEPLVEVFSDRPRSGPVVRNPAAPLWDEPGPEEV
jgi:hypothetical protein